jgi:hypothetical protein
MKAILIILLNLIVLHAIAQTVVKGSVRDSHGKAVPGANVILKGTYDGASTDTNGGFSFTSDQQGAQILIVSFIGYHDFTSEITLAGTEVTANVVLHERINQLEAVTISAGSFTASDASRRTIFRAVDIATTAGATADIAGALNTLPGTQKVGESGRLFVRGGDGSEARTFIDGMVVLDPYAPAAPNAPSRGRFLPFMFKGTSFSTGGYSAEYGQALSSALVLDSKDQAETTRTDLGLLSVGGDLTHVRSWGTGSVAAKLQYTNLGPYFSLIDQDIDWKTPPASVEGVAAFRQQVNTTGMLKVYGNFNESSYSLYNHDIDNYAVASLYKLQNRYGYVNTSYRNVLNDKWSFRTGFAYNHSANRIDVEDHRIEAAVRGSHVKAVLEGSPGEKVEIKTGVEILQRTYDETISRDDGVISHPKFSEWITSHFVESEIYFSNRIVSRVGARTEYNSLTSDLTIDPRISLAFRRGKAGQVSVAYGTFRQTAADQFVKRHPGLDNERAEHFILNYQRVENRRTFRIESYYKSYTSLVRWIAEGPLTNDGRGYARGAEVFWRDNRSLRGVDYWISYSFLDTEREYLNFPYRATPSFASKHNFSFVCKYFVQPLQSQLGATFSLTSGRPFQDPNGGRFNGSYTPSYQDLSFNWSYLPRPHVIVYFSCTNLLGRNNIFGYEFSDHPNDEGMYQARAVRQPARRFLFIGVFITISKDKSMNQLPTL